MLVSAENMAFGFAGSPLLEKIDFTLSEGDRVGLIGPNGEGKTTLIRLILSELEPEDGRIFVKNGIRIGYLAQNGGYDSENTVFEEMKEIFAEDIRALDSLRETEKKNRRRGGRQRRIPRPFGQIRGAQQADRRARQLSLRNPHPHRAERHGLFRILQSAHFHHVGRRKDEAEALPSPP